MSLNKIRRDKLMSKGEWGFDEWSCEKLCAALIVTCAVLLVLNYYCGVIDCQLDVKQFTTK